MFQFLNLSQKNFFERNSFGFSIGVCLLFFSLSSLLIKTFISEFPPIFFSSILMLIISLPMLRFAKFKRADFKKILFLGGLLALSRIFLFLSFDLFSAGLVEVVYDFPFSVILATFLLKEKLSPKEIGGISLAFIGIIFLSNDNQIQNIEWIFIPIIASFVGGFHSVSLKKFKIEPKELLAGELGVAGLITLLISLFIETGQAASLSSLSLPVIIGITTLMIFGIISQLLSFNLIEKYPVHKISPYFLLLPALVMMFEYFSFGTVISLKQGIGISLILGGIMFAQIRSHKKHSQIYSKKITHRH